MNARQSITLLAIAALGLATGCASRQPLVPQVHDAVETDGARTLSATPEPLACAGGPRCATLAASWTSAKPGQARLIVALPGMPAQVTGADVHIGGSEVVRLRVPAASPGAADAQGSGFDVPLRVIDRIAYGSRTWMRVYTAGGVGVDEHIHSGEQRSRASEAMAHFLVAVQAAGGQGAGVEGARGGLLDRLGGRGD